MRALTLLPYVLTLAAMLPTSAALAKDYIIEVILFENLFASENVSAPTLYAPRLDNAIGLSSNKAAAANFVVVEEDLVLTENAESIKQSKGYRLLSHFAWRQPGLDTENATAIRVRAGNGFKMFIPNEYQIYPDFIPAAQSASLSAAEREISSTVVNGTIKVRLGRFLHLDAKLVFTDTKLATSYRLNHNRKMRSRELHYLDNPKFGMLVKILPVPE